MPEQLFSDLFVTALQGAITAHHSVYPRLPPRDIFFEDLVARAFKTVGHTEISLSSPGRSREDMTIAGTRLSIKSETGYGTDPALITITKLSTTEETEWVSFKLITRILHHLDEYERMLMLRALWQPQPGFHYQLVEIPTSLLRLMESVTVVETGTRKGKKSLKAPVLVNGEKVFDLFFDAVDGKCVVRNLLVSHCNMLAEWDHPVPAEWQENWPIKPPKGKSTIVTNPPYEVKAKPKRKLKDSSLTLPGFSEDEPK